jgi:hypothetical protein
MKIPLCLAFLCVGQLALFAAGASDTAYTALRVIGKQNGADALNRVVEVRGRAGTPAPSVWKVVLNDPAARGGLREFEVQGGKVISERTPVARTSGPPINFNQLNLDSEGAYTVANQEAEKQHVPFDRIDYVLEGGATGPVWHLELFGAGEKIGYLDISADNGALLHRNLARAVSPSVTQQDRQFLREHSQPPPPRQAAPLPPPPPGPDRRIARDERDDPDYYERYDRERDYRDDDEDFRRDQERERGHRSFLEKVQNHFERRGMQIKRFFLGD